MSGISGFSSKHTWQPFLGLRMHIGRRDTQLIGLNLVMNVPNFFMQWQQILSGKIPFHS
jgi:hypothetical protein